MKDIGGEHGMERPGKRAPGDFGLDPQFAPACVQAILEDLAEVRRQQAARMLMAHRNGELERGIVEVRNAFIGRQFQCRIGIELGESCQLLKLSL